MSLPDGDVEGESLRWLFVVVVVLVDVDGYVMLVEDLM